MRLFVNTQVSAGTVNSWMFPNILEIKKMFICNCMLGGGGGGVKLLAHTIFFFDYYFKRYDGQVRVFKWNYFLFRYHLIVSFRTNSITYNVYTLF